ncbi:MAG: MFS transporter, partial [Gammaproteobacteria bacterium]
EILTAIRLNLLIMIALLVLATVTMIWLHSHCPRRLGCCSKIIFHVSYAIAASAVLISLLGLFEKGISNKTGAMTKSLLERLDVPAQMQLDLKQHLTLIDQNLLKHYTQDDADIQSIELYQHGKRLYYAAAPGITESDLSTLQVGVSPCTSKHFGFGSCTAITSDPSLILKVIVPTKRVYNRLFRAAKNLLMLFISTTLIANLFLNIANVFSTSTAQQLKSQQHKREFPERAESLLRPVFTLGVFIEGLNLAFLPNYLKHFTSGGPVSIFFTSYFLCFALALVPAGRYAARRHLPHMMIVAFILNFIGLYLLVFAQNIYWAIAARALSACGQGILLIAVQAHLLRLETGSTRSGGARLIVLGFNIGVISGTSIGALLASLFGEAPVFLIGMAVCVFCILYISRTITPTPSSTPRHPKHQLSISQLSIKTTLIASYLKNFLNPELLKLTLLIGIPAKAAFTGVLVFALPLVLSGFNLTKDEVGQILIFYSFGIVVTTTLINKISNTGISPAALLFMGCIGSGFGLIIISYTSSLSLAPTQLKIMITVGILLLGLFHGFIHAPAVTYIARLTHIKTEDRPALIANYRLLERVGHIMGPTLATLFLIQNGRFL